jgi:hypothetical protein
VNKTSGYKVGRGIKGGCLLFAALLVSILLVATMAGPVARWVQGLGKSGTVVSANSDAAPSVPSLREAQEQEQEKEAEAVEVAEEDDEALVAEEEADGEIIAMAEASNTADADNPALGGVEVFDYTPGGEGYGEVADDITCPEGLEDCLRVWQATNLKNLAWTFGLANYQVSDPAPKQQWPHPTQFTVTGMGTVEFNLFRDHGAIDQLRERGIYTGQDPYDVANAQNSPLGLGWFAQGFNAEICVDGECQELDGGGVYQLGFPKDMQGSYRIVLRVDNGQLNLWQGEKFTTVDNWPLPSDD